jgi:hypothetical protein
VFLRSFFKAKYPPDSKGKGFQGYDSLTGSDIISIREKCASYAISCKVLNFSKLTILKPIFADF